MGYDFLFFTHFLETFRLRFYVIHSICNYIFFASNVLSNGSRSLLKPSINILSDSLLAMHFTLQ